MRNTSDTPDANEQVQPATPRSRANARSKPESATPGSQAQGAKPTAQRRTASTTNAAPAARTQHAPTTTPSTPEARPAPAQRPAYTQRPAPAQRNSGAASPAQRNGGTTSPAQRPARPGTGSAPGRPTYTPARPGSRQGGTTAGGNRPAGQSHPAPTRPGNRPATRGPRPQERRVTVVKEKPTGPISIPPQIVVKDLAELLQTTSNEVIRGLIKHSIFASINQVVEYEKAALVAKELGFEPTQGALTVTRVSGALSIRKTKVAASEAGGITQHIGAYQVEVNGKKITFVDTPGHEAFTAMRARGAQVTHIAVIVVAADDGVMPQTREAIDHARAAKVPIIIAINKMDKPDANPDFVKQQLYDIGVVIEEFGGDVIAVPVSARKGTGIDDLLEMILLLAEVQDIRANPNRPATGVIIEAKLEKNTGPTATVLIQQGTLKMGDNIVVGSMAGKIRAMFNDRGKRIQKAPPSTPISILGVPEVPQAGDHLEVVADERTARQMATRVAEERRTASIPLGQVSLDSLYIQMQEGQVKELNIVLKCDVQGSAEAIKNALSKLGEEHIKVRLIHEGIGNINETDVHLAEASGAVIIGFNVKADGAAQRLAQKESVEIRYYNIIYKLIDDIQAALAGMLEPTYREVIEGHAEVQQTFKAGKNLVIAGCRVLDGKITRADQARITRQKEMAYDGKIASLRRGKDDVREVASGYECGIVLDDFTDYEVGDIIEVYAQERVMPGA